MQHVCGHYIFFYQMEINSNLKIKKYTKVHLKIVHNIHYNLENIIIKEIVKLTLFVTSLM